MKRLYVLVLVVALALVGCYRDHDDWHDRGPTGPGRQDDLHDGQVSERSPVDLQVRRGGHGAVLTMYVPGCQDAYGNPVRAPEHLYLGGYYPGGELFANPQGVRLRSTVYRWDLDEIQFDGQRHNVYLQIVINGHEVNGLIVESSRFAINVGEWDIKYRILFSSRGP